MLKKLRRPPESMGKSTGEMTDLRRLDHCIDVTFRLGFLAVTLMAGNCTKAEELNPDPQLRALALESWELMRQCIQTKNQIAEKGDDPKDPAARVPA